MGGNRSNVKSRRIAVVTVLMMAFSIMGFTTYLNTHAPNNWALPVYVGIVVVMATVGMALMWRVRGR